MTPVPPDLFVQIMANALANMNAMMQPLVEAVHGYKNQLMEHSFSEEIAEGMCLEYHAFLIEKMRA